MVIPCAVLWATGLLIQEASVCWLCVCVQLLHMPSIAPWEQIMFSELNWIELNSSVVTNWRGVAGSVWECPCRVVKDICELRVSESLGPLVGHWHNRPSCGLLRLGELCLGLGGCWCNVGGLLLCSKTAVPVTHRWILYSSFKPSVFSGQYI